MFVINILNPKFHRATLLCSTASPQRPQDSNLTFIRTQPASTVTIFNYVSESTRKSVLVERRATISLISIARSVFRVCFLAKINDRFYQKRRASWEPPLSAFRHGSRVETGLTRRKRSGKRAAASRLRKKNGLSRVAISVTCERRVSFCPADDGGITPAETEVSRPS